MKAKYDNQTIEITSKYIGILIQLMRAKCDMMVKNGRKRRDWAWGRCFIRDMSLASGSLEFMFGSVEDLPDDGCGQFAVRINESQRSC